MITHPTALEISADARRYADLHSRAHAPDRDTAPHTRSPRRFFDLPRLRLPGFARPRRGEGTGASRPAAPVVRS